MRDETTPLGQATPLLKQTLRVWLFSPELLPWILQSNATDSSDEGATDKEARTPPRTRSQAANSNPDSDPNRSTEVRGKPDG